MRQYYFNPFSFVLIVIVILLILLFLPLLFLGIIGGALKSLGFSGWEIFFLVIASVIGSFINIPVTRIAGVRNRAYPFRDRFGRMYAMHDGPDTTVAVNVGGAVIPLLVVLYLMYYVTLFTCHLPVTSRRHSGRFGRNSPGGRHYARFCKGGSRDGYCNSCLYSAALRSYVWYCLLLW